MLYCGYQGCGKTTYCKEHENAIDLDSSLFKKVDYWYKEYVELATTLSKDYDVFISAHKEVINTLIEMNINFSILAPSENKKTWQSRLEFRYNQNPILPNLKALNDFKNNYDKDIAFYKELEKKGIQVYWIKAKIQTDLKNYIK